MTSLIQTVAEVVGLCQFICDRNSYMWHKFMDITACLVSGYGLWFSFGISSDGLLIRDCIFFPHQIERFINSPEAHKNPPDYHDILQQVLRANERHKLCLSRKQLNQIAQEAFRETGSRMQERRHLDLVYNFGSHLTDTYKAGRWNEIVCKRTVFTVLLNLHEEVETFKYHDHTVCHLWFGYWLLDMFR